MTQKKTTAAQKPLASASVVITRPVGAAGTLPEKIRRLGGRPVQLPGLSLRATEDVDAVVPSLRRSHGAWAWLFTSPAAVRFAFRLLPSLRVPRRAQVLAVGQGTARALARRGIESIVPTESSTSEGVLALAPLKEVRGRRIVVVGAPGGRDLIVATLRRRGADVESIHVYRRVPPRLTRRHFDALAAASDPLIVLISSAEALANLVVSLAPSLTARLRGQIVVVSSDRLAGEAKRHGFGEIALARSASADDLVAAAAGALARHRL